MPTPVLAGEWSTYEGETVRLGGYRPPIPPPGGRVPLVLGALNPRSCRLVGELGVDGIALNQLAPHHVPQVLDEARRGAGDELPDGYHVVARLFCAVTDDVPADRIAAYCEAGVTVPVVQPLEPGRDAGAATLWALASAWDAR